MNNFGQNIHDAQNAAQMMAAFAIAVWVARVLVAIAAAVWIYRDAEVRGKNGIAAALIALLSAIYGISATVMLLCAWILFRPGKIRRGAAAMENSLPDELPSGIVGAPTSEEFLEELEN